jgi:hypothetical protein
MSSGSPGEKETAGNFLAMASTLDLICFFILASLSIRPAVGVAAFSCRNRRAIAVPRGETVGRLRFILLFLGVVRFHVKASRRKDPPARKGISCSTGKFLRRRNSAAEGALENGPEISAASGDLSTGHKGD